MKILGLLFSVLSLLPGVSLAGGEWAKAAIPRVLEVTEAVDLAKLERFAALPDLTIQIDLGSDKIPAALVELLDRRFRSNAKWVALPEEPTPAAVEQARRLGPAAVIVGVGQKGFDAKLAEALVALGKVRLIVVLPKDFGKQQLESVRRIAPAVLRPRGRSRC